MLGSKLRNSRQRNVLSIFDRTLQRFLIYILPTGSVTQLASHSVGTVGFLPGGKTAGG